MDKKNQEIKRKGREITTIQKKPKSSKTIIGKNI